jgi:GlpG protein
MRLIQTFIDNAEALKFHAYLASETIESVLETTDNESKFNLWIIKEDEVEIAAGFLREFLANPASPKFENLKIPSPKDETKDKPRIIKFKKHRLNRSGMGPITLFILITCVVLYLSTELGQFSINSRTSAEEQRQLRNPVLTTLQYDYPTQDHIGHLLTERYGAGWIHDTQSLDPAGKLLLVKFLTTPNWKGFYNEYLLRHHAKASNKTEIPWSEHGTLFQRIRRGEVWRLITPAVLHGGIFHIFFNLAWLMTLGTQMEVRMGGVRYLFFILLTAAFSNTCQYLMGGHHFLGLSGVICAMIGFIWIRQRTSPWEGYLLQAGQITFVTIFVLGIAAYQLYHFLNALNSPGFGSGVGIANTAHIAGGLIGVALGRTSFFAWSKGH